jgi:hypothetical protein
MEPNRIKLSSFFNATIVLGIVTAYLYVFGSIYWLAYFSSFGVAKFRDLSFEETISSSWLFTFTVVFPVLFQVFFYRKSDIAVGYLLFIFIMPTLFATAWYYTNNNWIILFALLSSVLLLIPWANFLKYKFTLNTNICFCLATIFFLFSMILAIILGEGCAKRLLRKDESHYNTITLTVEGDIQPPKNAIFLAHMSGKYIIYPRFQINKESSKTIVIEDSRVLNAEIEVVKKAKKDK